MPTGLCVLAPRKFGLTRDIRTAMVFAVCPFSPYPPPSITIRLFANA